MESSQPTPADALSLQAVQFLGGLRQRMVTAKKVLPTAPLTAPLTALLTSQLAAPLTAPLAAPLTAPLTAPFTAPLTAPSTAPIKAPFSAPFTVRFKWHNCYSLHRNCTPPACTRPACNHDCIQQPGLVARQDVTHPQYFDCPFAASAVREYTFREVQQKFGSSFKDIFWPVFQVSFLSYPLR